MANVSPRAIASLALALVLAPAASAAAAPDDPPAAAPAPQDPNANLPAPKPREPQWKIDLRRESLYREGQALIQQERWQEALDKLREVNAIRSHPKVLLLIGYSEEQLGHLLQAKALYLQAQADAQTAKLKTDEQAAAQALEALAPKIPHIVIHLPLSEGAVVSLDGAQTPIQKEGVEVNPGPHTLSVTWPKQRSFQTEVVAKMGEVSTVEVVVPPLPPPPKPPKPPPPPPPPPSGPPTGAITLGLAGGVGLVAGAPVFGAGLSKQNTGLIVAGSVIGIGGLGLLVSGVVWGVNADDSSAGELENNAARPRRAPVALQFSLAPSPGGLWGSVGGRF